MLLGNRHGLAINYPNYNIPSIGWTWLTCFVGCEFNDWLLDGLNKDLKLCYVCDQGNGAFSADCELQLRYCMPIVDKI